MSRYQKDLEIAHHIASSFFEEGHDRQRLVTEIARYGAVFRQEYGNALAQIADLPFFEDGVKSYRVMHEMAHHISNVAIGRVREDI